MEDSNEPEKTAVLNKDGVIYLRHIQGGSLDVWHNQEKYHNEYL